MKLECVSKFCYIGDTLGAGGVEEAARARVRCAWAKFKELSPILTAQSASYRIKGKIYKACVQSVLTYGTETWAMKKANLHSLERTEQMMARWRIGNAVWICTVFCSGVATGGMGGPDPPTSIQTPPEISANLLKSLYI